MPKADPSWARDVMRGRCRVPGCTDLACSIDYGECHCGCGEATLRARQSDRRLNLVKDEPQRYLRGHARMGKTTAKVKARERVCAREGCETKFSPTPDQIERGAGRYCSPECYWVAATKYPQPAERLCALEGCDKPARRVAPAQAAAGRGLYCSRRHADLGKSARVGKKVTLHCANCGREKLMRRWYVERGQRFCSSLCWAKWRWREGRFPRKLINKAWWSEKAWRSWEGRYYGKHGGGRPRRRDARPDYDEAVKKIRQKYAQTHASERDLAQMTGESRDFVRVALGRS